MRNPLTSSGQTVIEKRVLSSAHAWWKQHRPDGWTLADHMKNPTVNTTTQTEAALARRVVAMVDPGRQRT